MEIITSWLERLLGMPPQAYFQQNVVQNEWLLGIALSGAIFSLLYLLRALPSQLVIFFRRQFFNELELESQNDFYSHVLSYLTQNGHLKSNTRRLYLDERIPIFARIDNKQNEEDIDWFTSSGLVFGSGWHWSIFKGRPLIIFHEFKDQSSNTGQRPRLLRIYLPGRSNKFMMKFIREVADFQRRHHAHEIPIYERERGDWGLSCYRKKRELSTLAWDQKHKQELVDDIDWFFKAEQWYQLRGIPYRRSFLLYGPPGTGKTSMVFSYASAFNAPIYMINLSTIPDDGTLISMFSKVPMGSFLLLEDIDAMGVDTDERHGGSKLTDEDDNENDRSESPFGITLSGLLNALDGIVSPTGIVVWMTTNYPDKLDQALLRPGRVDRRIHIGYSDYKQARQLYHNFYCDHEEGNWFAQAFMNQSDYKTPADLQELLIEHHGSPQKATEELKSRSKQQNAA